MAYSQHSYTFKTAELAEKACLEGWKLNLFVRWTPNTNTLAFMGGAKEIKAIGEHCEAISSSGENEEGADDPEGGQVQTSGGEGGQTTTQTGGEGGGQAAS